MKVDGKALLWEVSQELWKKRWEVHRETFIGLVEHCFRTFSVSLSTSRISWVFVSSVLVSKENDKTMGLLVL